MTVIQQFESRLCDLPWMYRIAHSQNALNLTYFYFIFKATQSLNFYYALCIFSTRGHEMKLKMNQSIFHRFSVSLTAVLMHYLARTACLCLARLYDLPMLFSFFYLSHWRPIISESTEAKNAGHENGRHVICSI